MAFTVSLECYSLKESQGGGGGERMTLFFQRKFVNCLLKQIFRIGRKLEEIAQNAKKVARNTKSCQKVAEQLVESPRRGPHLSKLNHTWGDGT